MRRKVSLWVVIALVGALAAATAATAVLAQRDDRANDPRRGEGPAAGSPGPGSEDRGEWQGPVTGSVSGWERDGEAPILPWILFAVASGTAVGLLVAWSPWRAQPATVTAGPPENSDGSAQASETLETSPADETTEAIVADEAATREAPPQA